MVRNAIPLSVIALAVLAGCASEAPVRPAPAPVVVTPTPAPVVVTPPAAPSASAPAPVVVVQPTPTAIRPGFGRIESIAAVPPSAAAGGASMRRFGIKMEDGTVQYVDTAAPGYALGDRIELTRDGYIRR
jgi:hypothetical protein